MDSLPTGVTDARPTTEHQAGGVRPLPLGLASTLVFLASGAVLVLETVSLRLVGPYLGVTLQVTSAVIGVALAAIAYGAWLGGWLADRRDPRPLLAPALVLSGIATAVTLPLVRYAGELLSGGATGAILLLTALAVFLPAALLAAVTPLVVKLQLGDLRRTGQVVGRLSSIGTLGGITATLATGFVLVAALSTTVIMLGLSALLVLAGIALGIYLRRRDRTGVPGALRLRAGLVVLGLAGAGLAAVAPNPCDVETAYHCASVEADPGRPSGRVLRLNSAEHSYVDLADPRHLHYAYTQWIGAVTDVMAPPGRPLEAVHLGGGGFTVPRYLTATRPGSGNTVFEIDGGLVALGERELGLRPGADLRPVVGDARMLVGRRAGASADLVVGDAFGYLVVPWHLATREMAAQIRRVIRPNGLYVQNVIDHPPLRFIRSELATVAAEFAHVALIAPPAAIAGEQGANFVIVASPSPLPLDALRARLTATVTDPVTLLAGAPLAEFVGDALVLTDEYAPVDQLLATA
ncbi:fused MFS/spermidine synthase [Micromonospora sp. NPDC049559]|uniref:fused MFS/spermidine synthase n=1 Tax=Micromonospora sp. NPDC049559 TaxID=3155923 RepID=UPI00341D32A6